MKQAINMVNHMLLAVLFLVPLSCAMIHNEARKNSGYTMSGPYKYPFLDPSLTWEERTEDLVSRLTLEEIVPQTGAVYGQSMPPIPRLGIKPYVWITECLRGEANHNTTAFPQAIGLASSFRY